MTGVCTNEQCPEYGKEVEVNLDDEGNYKIGIKKICSCGQERQMVEYKRYAHFHIDEIALGTKRLFSKPNPKLKYSHEQ